MCCVGRYLFVDHMLAAVQASPQSKVATLSSESLELMMSAQAELQSMSSSQVCSSHTWPVTSSRCCLCSHRCLATVTLAHICMFLTVIHIVGQADSSVCCYVVLS